MLEFLLLLDPMQLMFIYCCAMWPLAIVLLFAMTQLFLLLDSALTWWEKKKNRLT